MMNVATILPVGRIEVTEAGGRITKENRFILLGIVSKTKKNAPNVPCK